MNYSMPGKQSELSQQSHSLEEVHRKGHRADTLTNTDEFKDTVRSLLLGFSSLKEKRPESLGNGSTFGAVIGLINIILHTVSSPQGLASAWHLADAQ